MSLTVLLQIRLFDGKTNVNRYHFILKFTHFTELHRISLGFQCFLSGIESTFTGLSITEGSSIMEIISEYKLNLIE